MTDITDEQIVEAWGGNARIHNKTLQIKTQIDIRRDIDGKSVGEVIEFLLAFDSEATIDTYVEHCYDVEFVVINVNSWIDVTPEKRAEMVKAIQARNLKRERPHLFLDT